jgi:tripartite ATP-independent transporter DctP family solute receptor
MLRNKVSRRRAIAGAGGLTAATILHWPANAAEFTYKMGSSSPMDHPAMAHYKIAADKIREQSNGQLNIVIYPNSQLGGDTAMISQLISGAMQMYSLPIDLLAPRNPVCGITGVGFAFPTYDDVWKAMDGDLGKMLRETVAGMGVQCMDATYDHGFRHVTTRTKPIVTADDLVGFKIRLPVAPFLISLFRHLGAAPTALNFSEVYSALQTGIMDGQENPLVLIDTAKLYEVQKYCSLTGHIWSGFHAAFNMASWQKLPAGLQELAHKHFVAEALVQRQDFYKMTEDERTNLTGKGMIFNKPDPRSFRQALSKSGYYPDIRKTAGDKAWAALEKYAGHLG